ncbi:hypothetical protein ACIHCQ_21485 [Streptomyces sp. NPDC052236]|uniref:hypothetical protein n=1 Tax=Streptomyces sp. NPDC052236 TaxID=3365686 RepID=UPI0037D93783
MSVLSFPRIYFRGLAEWNPALANGNDVWPVVDSSRAELNWSYLEEVGSGITPENVRDKFPEWARKLRTVEEKNAQGQVRRRWQQTPGQWNYYGGMEWALHTRTKVRWGLPTENGPSRANTIVTGIGDDGRYSEDDALVTKAKENVKATVNVVGDRFPGSTFHTPARMTDNPFNAYWATNFYLRKFQLGTTSAPEHFLSGEIEPGTYMTSRWLNLQRNLNEDGYLRSAGIAGVVLQACLPKETLQINPGTSSILQKFDKTLREDKTVRGLMVRINAHSTLYFNLDGFPTLEEFRKKNKDHEAWLTAMYRRMVQMWNEDIEAGRTPSQNPAVAKIVGTVGLWLDDDFLTSSPGDRMLRPENPFRIVGQNTNKMKTFLGPTSARKTQVGNDHYITVDLGNTIPEINIKGEKYDLGDLTLKLKKDSDDQTTLATIKKADYEQSRYEKTAGIVDIKLPQDVDIDKGALILQGTLKENGQSKGIVDLLTECRYTVDTDQRSVYIEQNPKDPQAPRNKVTITVHIRDRGKVPDNSVKIRLWQYVPNPYPPAPGAHGWQLISKDAPGVVEISPQEITVPGKQGKATFDVMLPEKPSADGSIQPAPGNSIIVFAPHDEGFPAAPPKELTAPPIPAHNDGTLTTVWAPFCSVRVMPFDNALPEAFRKHWNSTKDREKAWQFLYENVLCMFDVIYPVMRYNAGLDLGDQLSVEKNIDLIVDLADPKLRDQDNSTVYMPVSRDLSAGKREVLMEYQKLVKNDWSTSVTL